LRLSGDYHAVIRYFETLQTLPWRFQWNRMHYEVQSYPKAVVTLQVHTLSMSKEWIGV
jgi:MSHA biogenesis protein MshJ